MHGTDSRLNTTDLCVITEFGVVNEKQHLIIRSHCVAKTLMESCKLIRDAALKSSNKAAARMIARRLKARTPTEYHVDDEVLVRFFQTFVQAVGETKLSQVDNLCTRQSNCRGPRNYKYRVEFTTADGRNNNWWFTVTDVTSPSMHLETLRHIERMISFVRLEN